MFNPDFKRNGLSAHGACLRCRMYLPLCICSLLPNLNLRTRVVVFMHRKEYVYMTNTGALLTKALVNSDLVFRGHEGRTVVAPERILVTDSNPYILFPSDDAQLLDEELAARLPRPLTLIVPDGHWGQARKIVTREPSLAGLPRIKLPPGAPSRYRLRRNPVPGRVCTYEAVCRTLGILEGPQVQAAMEIAFEAMVERILWGCGRPVHE